MGNITTEKGGKKGANKNNYAVAFNKVTKKLMNKPEFQKVGKQQIADLFNSPNLPFGTTSVDFIEKQWCLVDENNGRFDEESKLKLFENIVMNTPTIHRMLSNNLENLR